MAITKFVYALTAAATLGSAGAELLVAGELDGGVDVDEVVSGAEELDGSVEATLVEGLGLSLPVVQPATTNAAQARTAVMIAAGFLAATTSSTPPALGVTPDGIRGDARGRGSTVRLTSACVNTFRHDKR